mmetsp:Transcript_38805/g.51131  ORF Transcript_38805/g.51131 Transcript_38805/m.51131 type:complete len:277 (+) Transcript_38805:114-944(+)
MVMAFSNLFTISLCLVGSFMLRNAQAENHGTTYLAKFNATQTSGFSGTYTLYIDNDTESKTATHTLSIDTSLYSGPCNMSYGLKWHIHALWTDLSGGSSDSCGATKTGGHFDPYLGCGSATHETALCDEVRPSDNYTYSCNSTTYEKDINTCEMGDLSSRFGLATIEDDMISMESNGLWVGKPGSRIPPVVYDYNLEADILANLDQTEGELASVVFHCIEPASRLFCAKMVRQSDDDSDDSTDEASSSSYLNISLHMFCLQILIMAITFFSPVYRV